MKKYYIGIALILLIGLASFFTHYAVTSETLSDQQKLRDISALQDKISAYVDDNKKLPESLADLNLGQQKVAQRINNYTYRTKGRSEDGYDFLYEICADFKTEKKGTDYHSRDGIDYVALDSEHEKGKHCFQLKAYAPYDYNRNTNLPAVSPAKPISKLDTDPNLIYCGQSNQFVTSVYAASTVDSINLASKQLTAKKGAATSYFYWNAVPEVYDSACKKIDINQLKAGDIVTVYYGGTNNTPYAIKKDK